MSSLGCFFARSTAVAALALLPLASQAAIELRLDDLATAGVDVSVTDNGAGDVNAALGAITYVGGAGVFNFNVSTGLGDDLHPLFGIDLASLDLSSLSGGTLRVSFSENNLNFGSSGLLPVTGSIGGTTTGAVSYALYADDGNALFGTGSTIFAGSSTGPAFSASGRSDVALSDPFSLSLVVDITHPSPGLTSFDFEARVPEPGTLALFSIGLFGLGLFGARRRAAA